MSDKLPTERKIPSTSTRRDISVAIASTHRIPQSLAYQIIDTTFEALLDNLKANGHVELRGFGVFEIVERKGRTGRNPKKPSQEVWIPNHKTIKFKASRLLRDELADANLPQQRKRD